MTDVEGSTPAWERDPDGMVEAITTHDAIIAAAVDQHGGILLRERGEGDSWFAVFVAADAAVASAALVQAELSAKSELRVRIGLHTAVARLVGGSYYGPEVNLCARIRSAGHGGQVLLSAACAAAAEGGRAAVRDLGQYRLRGFSVPERIFQLVVPGLPDAFPPLVTLDLVEQARRSLAVSVAPGAPAGSVGVEVLDAAAEGDGFSLVVSLDDVVVERFDGLTIGGVRDAVRLVNEQSRCIRLSLAGPAGLGTSG